MPTRKPPRIYVLAGVNGSGKSSVAGAQFRANGAGYYNPDEAARALRTSYPGMSQTDANAAAWRRGFRLLSDAIEQRMDFAFETTLGASSIPKKLVEAADKGCEVYVWYAGLATPEQHIARVRARVKRGGHDIPEAAIRRRFEHSRINLIMLLPKLTALRIIDNSVEADPAAGKTPAPMLVLHMNHRKVVASVGSTSAPEWAKPILAAAYKLHSA